MICRKQRFDANFGELIKYHLIPIIIIVLLGHTEHHRFALAHFFDETAGVAVVLLLGKTVFHIAQIGGTGNNDVFHIIYVRSKTEIVNLRLASQSIPQNGAGLARISITGTVGNSSRRPPAIT